jgi:hypothetical protein
MECLPIMTRGTCKTRGIILTAICLGVMPLFQPRIFMKIGYFNKNLRKLVIFTDEHQHLMQCSCYGERIMLVCYIYKLFNNDLYNTGIYLDENTTGETILDQLQDRFKLTFRY